MPSERQKIFKSLETLAVGLIVAVATNGTPDTTACQQSPRTPDTFIQAEQTLIQASDAEAAAMGSNYCRRITVDK